MNGEGRKKRKGMSILVFSGDLDKVLAAFVIANGAAAMEVPVTLFFAFWGINALRREERVRLRSKKSLVEKMFGWMMPNGPNRLKLSNMHMGGLGSKLLKREMSKKGVLSLPHLIDKAREEGIKMVACTMSMNIMGIREEELIDGIDYAGVASFVDIANESESTLFV